MQVEVQQLFLQSNRRETKHIFRKSTKSIKLCLSDFIAWFFFIYFFIQFVEAFVEFSESF